MRKTRKSRTGKKGSGTVDEIVGSNENQDATDPAVADSLDEVSPAMVPQKRRSRLGKRKGTGSIADQSPIRRSVKRVTNQRLDIIERLKSQEHLLENKDPSNSEEDVLGRLRISDDERHEKDNHETKSSSEAQTLSEDEDSVHGLFDIKEADSQEEGELLDKCRQNGVMLSSDEELPNDSLPTKPVSYNTSFVDSEEQNSGIIREVPNAPVLGEGVLCPPGSLCWNSQDPDSLLESSDSDTPKVIERIGSLSIYVTRDGKRKHRHRRHKKHSKPKIE